jgi:hypothetical protein
MHLSSLATIMGDVLLADDFDYPHGLLTNEYATRHPGDPGIYVCDNWIATSGSLFVRDGEGYSGLPDGGENGVTIDSIPENGSAVLRVISRRIDFANVEVTFDIHPIQLVTTPRTPEKDWNGLHVFIRRQDENNTYYVDVGRRDGLIQIKRKRDGSYDPLAMPVRYPMAFGSTRNVRVAVATLPDGSVELRLALDGVEVQRAIDSSERKIVAPGAIGVRGDNCEFTFDNFSVMEV